MVELKTTVELVNWARQVIGDCVQLPDSPWLDPLWIASAAVGVGLVLALWGGRVLRPAVVVGFMVAGAAAGKRVAGSLQVDLLLGLVIGAGVAGLIGYLFYRWWLGLTIGTVVALLAAATFSAPRILDERQAFEDYRLGVGTGRYDTSRVPLYSMTDMRDYFWQQRRDLVYRTLGPPVLTGLLGLVVAILVPRLASMVGTSILGVLALAGGAGALIASRWPDGWSHIQAHPAWATAVVGVFLLFSLLYQATHPGRPAVRAPVMPTPASAT
ncbi:MAG: hypothetical protein HY718_05175 [Planctomycetes bacterium]|nr:hypothetical protein [Planctomycetota bacterium]